VTGVVDLISKISATAKITPTSIAIPISTGLVVPPLPSLWPSTTEIFLATSMPTGGLSDLMPPLDLHPLLLPLNRLGWLQPKGMNE
jgi:hypothetical protein